MRLLRISWISRLGAAGFSVAILVVGAAGAAETPQRAGTLRVAISQMGPTPDPVVTTFGTNWMTAGIACEGLFAVDAKWKPPADARRKLRL